MPDLVQIGVCGFRIIEQGSHAIRPGRVISACPLLFDEIKRYPRRDLPRSIIIVVAVSSRLDFLSLLRVPHEVPVASRRWEQCRPYISFKCSDIARGCEKDRQKSRKSNLAYFICKLQIYFSMFNFIII